mgnify:CR=1 FL=1
MFAVVQTGGKQYRVTVGQSLQVEKLSGVKGDTVEFDRVLLLGEGDQVTTGTPVVEGARVHATLSRQERGPKIVVFRYKSKKRVRVKKGHRQSLTRVYVRDITLNGESLTPKPAAAPPTEETPASPEVTAPEVTATASEAPVAAAENAESGATAEPAATEPPAESSPAEGEQ